MLLLLLRECCRLEVAEQISELLDAAPKKEPHSCSTAHNLCCCYCCCCCCCVYCRRLEVAEQISELLDAALKKELCTNHKMHHLHHAS
jgi:hypothetical protein